MAIESVSGDMQAIMVSMDILEGTYNLQKDLRRLLSGQLSGFNLKNLVLNATHTHTAPYLFTPPDRSQPADMMTGDEYRNKILLPKLADMIVAAWNSRAPAAVGFAKGTVDVGYNRICVYQDGHSKMYGSTVIDNGSAFAGFEAGNDQSLNLMYCFDTGGNIKGIVINIACPSQDVEDQSVVSADFWGEARSQLQSKYPGVYILEQCSASGDQSPRKLASDEGSNSLSRLTTHATRITNEVKRLFSTAKSSRQSSVELNNQVSDLMLTQKVCYGSSPFTWELHAIRIGNIVFANNPFELYIDYGNAIKAQSMAAQTFLVQLSGTASDDFLVQYLSSQIPTFGNLYVGYTGGYLPTAKSVHGLAYGSWDSNGRVGPNGGAQLVNQTVSLINSMFCNDTTTANSSCTVDVSRPGAVVADICRGQQIEEFNHQFEGGLYAQLISNPSFEEIDTKFNNNPTANWSLIKSGHSNGNLCGQTSSETSMLNSCQNHCIKLEVISVASGSVGMANGGYWGIKFENNTKYKVSFWAKKGSNFSGTIKAKLESNYGTVYAQSAEFKPTASWQHFTCDLTTSGISSVTGTNRFVIYASTTGDVFFDVVTVMPPTWKNRPNGLRPDLAERLDALKFKYIQFPGGCTAESVSMEKCWNWKNSIGLLEQRPGSTRNRWWYKNDLYFGLDEYFQLCEDLGAEPVYVTSAGIDERPNVPEWYAICPLDKMQPIIDDILDLLEYCNGSASTTWGTKRAANGHTAPYNLKFIEIGNENGRKETESEYSSRYSMIYRYVKAAYPNVQVMYNGTRRLNEPSHTFGNQVDFADEHFYEKDLSILYNKYDSIDPACKKICVAEYASNSHSNAGIEIGNFRDALGDAAFMLGCEKNSERIWWTGYGNYAGFVGHGDFGPCIVWNDAVSNFVTPSYYMQKILFSDNQGTRVLPFIQNTANCFWSASIDTESGKNNLLLKVVNKSGTSESVDIILKGVDKVDPAGHSTTLTGAPDDENSLANPTKVVPLTGTFAAGSSFKYLFQAYSVTVLRIGL